MSNAELLVIEPSELKFSFELRKQISCSLQLSNKTDEYVAFKVKTTNPTKYCVRPLTGVVLPRSTVDVTVTMQAQKEAPTDLVCRDKFLVQSVLSTASITVKDITAEMFAKESGIVVEESKLRVVYVASSQPPSPVGGPFHHLLNLQQLWRRCVGRWMAQSPHPPTRRPEAWASSPLMEHLLAPKDPPSPECLS